MRALRYAVAVSAAAAAGGAATTRAVRDWYPRLDKPPWTPPSQAFGPVWTALYAQMAWSAWRVDGTDDPRRRRALALWWLQLGLNAAWSPTFFGARRTGAGAVVVTALVPAVAATAVESARVDRAAGLAYAPYLVWTSFAAALNIAILRRNR